MDVFINGRTIIIEYPVQKMVFAFIAQVLVAVIAQFFCTGFWILRAPKKRGTFPIKSTVNHNGCACLVFVVMPVSHHILQNKESHSLVYSLIVGELLLWDY